MTLSDECEESDKSTFEQLIPQIEAWAKENNNDPDKVSSDMWNMFRFKSVISRMIPVLMGSDGIDNKNEAVPLLGLLLNCILTITSQQDSEYSWNALNCLSDICVQIMKDTGTPSEQFELMIQTAGLGQGG